MYKPVLGARPLHDFDVRTLPQREVAAYLVSEALGWGLVPGTVLRDDAPLGRGSLQLFVEHDPREHYFTLLPGREPEFRRLAVFDMLANNADRKSGHCLLDEDGRVWAIDNGLTFHIEFKLRTVIWDFAGEPIPATERRAAAALAAELGARGPVHSALGNLLTPREMRALQRRAEAVSRPGNFPAPYSGWSFPWPLV